MASFKAVNRPLQSGSFTSTRSHYDKPMEKSEGTELVIRPHRMNEYINAISGAGEEFEEVDETEEMEEMDTHEEVAVRSNQATPQAQSRVRASRAQSLESSSPAPSSTLTGRDKLLNTIARAQGRKPAKKRSPNSSRQSRRLAPHQENISGKLISPADRFSWNVGYFLNSVLGKDKAATYHYAEHLAEGMFKAPRTPMGLNADESADLNIRKGPSFSWRAYRGLRARIVIGCALTYEHNLRGYSLNLACAQHPACRPNLDDKFSYVNCGMSQAQTMILGTDVSEARWIFPLMQDQWIPKFPDLKAKFETYVSEHGREIDERNFPAFERRILYEHFVRWMIDYRPAIPDHLFFAIRAYEVYKNPYEKDAALKLKTST